jgi:hypothetical protein
MNSKHTMSNVKLILVYGENLKISVFYFFFFITSYFTHLVFMTIFFSIIPFIITQNFENRVKTRKDTSVLDLQKMTSNFRQVPKS